jgi:hypothetical protein
METDVSSWRAHAATLRDRAWRGAGIDGATADRLCGEHARLNPCTLERGVERAAQVLDLDERGRLMRGIAALYAKLYAAAPERFLWAGFAAIAVNDGVRPAAELAVGVAELVGLAGAIAPALRARLSEIAGAAEDGIKLSFETNYAIFADLGWVHLAFLDGGIEALHALHRAGELDEQVLEGFEDIAHGAHIGGEAGEEAIARGNLTLFRHEQAAAATPVFTRYGRAVALATRAGLITVPNRKVAARAESLGRGPEWTDTNSAADSYGPFSRRWQWLVRHAWEPVVTLHRDRRDRGCRTLDAEVARAACGAPESERVLSINAGLPWRHALRVTSVLTKGLRRSLGNRVRHRGDSDRRLYGMTPRVHRQVGPG